MTLPKPHYRQQLGRWRCRDGLGQWWWMPPGWRPGQSIDGFCWR